jgi:hypothetical protein
MRNPGAFNMTYRYWSAISTASGPAYDPVGNPPQVQFDSSSTFQFPDLNASNICVPCHSGRNNGAAVHNLNNDQSVTVDFRNLLFGDAHRFTSAATMFRSIGYEYAGRDYSDPAGYMHDKIGTAAAPDTGTSGPCVGCHMYRANGNPDHFMKAVSKSGQTIVAVASEVCFTCHRYANTALAKQADDERLAYANAKAALAYFLGPVAELTTGWTTTIAPSTSNWLSPGDTDVTGNATGKNNLGALFNSRYLNFERGAYIHNNTYMKRLIYDSIDWLDDNQLNYSTGTTIVSACSGTPPHPVPAPSWCGTGLPTGAASYLLPNGVAPGAPAERP